MTSILQSKLAKKVVLLFALTAALVYLRTPGHVQAETCQQKCDFQFASCFSDCGFPANPNCTTACDTLYNRCLAGCR